MKRLIFTLITIVNVAMGYADSAKSLFVTFTDNTKVEFALSALPEVTVANDQLTVKTAATTATYDLQKVSTFTYGGATTGISTITETKADFDGDRLIVDGQNQQYRVFAVDGKAVKVSSTVANGRTVISLSALPPGVYIINIGGKSIKVAKK